jgi:ElaB/YqjD/DUF883 family membrane-anchored ribosome-binding protein
MDATNNFMNDLRAVIANAEELLRATADQAARAWRKCARAPRNRCAWRAST